MKLIKIQEATYKNRNDSPDYSIASHWFKFEVNYTKIKLLQEIETLGHMSKQPAKITIPSFYLAIIFSSHHFFFSLFHDLHVSLNLLCSL